MDQAVKEDWLAALRSGEFSQARHSLYKVREGEEKYCCLGVLCELYRREKGGRFDPGKESFTDTTFANSELTLPTDVKEWAGLECRDPEVHISGSSVKSGKVLDLEKTHLSALNDGIAKLRPHSFNKIADLIEESL